MKKIIFLIIFTCMAMQEKPCNHVTIDIQEVSGSDNKVTINKDDPKHKKEKILLAAIASITSSTIIGAVSLIMHYQTTNSSCNK